MGINTPILAPLGEQYTPGYLSIKRAAGYMDAPVSTLYDWIKRGIIPPEMVIRIGGRMFLNRKELDTFLAHHSLAKKRETIPQAVQRLYNSIQSNPANHAGKE